MRGMNPIFMDPYDGVVLGQPFDPHWEPIRRAMGYTHAWARRMNLADMTPQNQLSSSAYCLANPGAEYLVYLPEGGPVEVDLTAARGKLWMEWFVPSTGIVYPAAAVGGGRSVRLDPPFSGGAVLYISARRPGSGAPVVLP